MAAQEESGEYEIDRVVSFGGETDDQRYFTVKWKGYGSQFNSQEPEINIINCDPYYNFCLKNNMVPYPLYIANKKKKLEKIKNRKKKLLDYQIKQLDNDSVALKKELTKYQKLMHDFDSLNNQFDYSIQFVEWSLKLEYYDNQEKKINDRIKQLCDLQKLVKKEKLCLNKFLEELKIIKYQKNLEKNEK